MTNETIIKAVKRICNGKCTLIDYYQSETSRSLYFTISNGNVVSYFRISDHPTKKSIRSFTVSKNTKTTSVERYVESTIKKMERKSLYAAFELIMDNRPVVYA